eukprot:m.83196 g.83196  ORF g.83196 m.83196 type:complete len:69 (-) comp12115_c0_seq3:1482-1688(-)
MTIKYNTINKTNHTSHHITKQHSTQTLSSFTPLWKNSTTAVYVLQAGKWSLCVGEGTTALNVRWRMSG